MLFMNFVEANVKSFPVLKTKKISFFLILAENKWCGD